MGGVYYRVVGGEPLAYCLDFRERRVAVRNEWRAFSEAKGAKGFVNSWDFLSGLIFDYGVEIPKGLIKHKKPAADGSPFYRPSKKTPEGKALHAEFDALPREPDNNEFAKRFGVPTSLSYRKGEQNYGGMVLNGIFPYASFVAWVDDEFFVVLPDVDAAIADKTAQGYVCEPASWSPPEGIERSSRAHYDLALAKQAVAEQEVRAA